MIKKLTGSLYHRFSGGPPPSTIKGVASTDGDEVYAVCGTMLMAGVNFIIFGAKQGFSKRDIITGWGMIKETLDGNKRYYAIIDRELDTAHDMLNHFNFTHIGDDIYEYRGK